MTDAIKTPQLTLFATSDWHPLPIVTAIATAVDQPAFLYVSRRLGDEAPCSQPLGPVVPQVIRNARIENVGKSQSCMFSSG